MCSTHARDEKYKTLLIMKRDGRTMHRPEVITVNMRDVRLLQRYI